jgi:3-phenylpropionate/cinnamic acid dioxygenase small subunit
VLTRERAEDFLYREAQYADEHRFDEWLALWAADEILYWIPAGDDAIDPKQRVSIAYDDAREMLEERITRLKSKGMHSQQPRSRVRRLLSNVAIVSDDGHQAQVEANFLLAELRRGKQDLFAGRMIFQLRYDATTIRIGGKKVLLLNNDESIDNMTFLV